MLSRSLRTGLSGQLSKQFSKQFLAPSSQRFVSSYSNHEEDMSDMDPLIEQGAFLARSNWGINFLPAGYGGRFPVRASD